MVNFIREQYPPGTRIRLNSMDDPYAPILPGTEGEVDFVDDIGTIHMKWDNGRTLGIVPGEDSFTVLPPKLTTLKLYMPLTADLYERNEYGDLDDSSTLLEGRELRGYQDQITAALVKKRMPEEAERGLMHWYDEADSVDRKVCSAVFTVEKRDRQLWGVAECRVAGELSDTELGSLKNTSPDRRRTAGARALSSGKFPWMTAVNCMSTFGTRTSGASKRSRSFSPPSWRRGCRSCASPRSPAPGSSSASGAVKAATTPCDWSTDDPTQNQELADYNNERLGVTREQRLAMECGSMHGWGVPGADPSYYEQKMGGMKFGYMGGLSKQLNMSCIGATNYSQKTIYLSEASATLHEFGHFLDWTLGFPAEHEQLFRAEAAAAPLRNYAKTNAREYFADCFAYWVKYAENANAISLLQECAPMTYRYMEDLMRIAN